VQTSRDRVLTLPSTRSVIVLSAWNWTLSPGRRERLERWVEGGGRLIVEQSLLGGADEFRRWSGIAVQGRPPVKRGETPIKVDEPCRSFAEASATRSPNRRDFRTLCYAATMTYLSADRPEDWSLRDVTGAQVLRVRVGRGAVTRINASTFRDREILDGDHGWLFAAAAELRAGDEVHFLSEDNSPSLLALMWSYGAPVVVLAAALVALLLWRGGVRFGPPVPPPPLARRSLAEQIRGTGRFVARRGSAAALHAACVRALEEAAARRVPGFMRLTLKDRAAALGRLTRFDPGSLLAALYHPRSQRAHELRSAVALIEAARRDCLTDRRGLSHGTD